MVGSIAEELIRRVNIPVCTVGPHFRPLPQETPPGLSSRFRCAVAPEQSFQFAANLAEGLQAELTVLHVTEQERFDDDANAGARCKINEMVSTEAAASHSHTERRTGGRDPCRVRGSQALVAGARVDPRASTVSARFRNGVVYRVMARLHCPAFTLRSGTKAKAGANYHEFSTIAREP